MTSENAPYWECESRGARAYVADARHMPFLEAKSVDCCITSPPYFNLRDYRCAGEIGKESAVPDYIGALSLVFTEVHRVLKPEGTLWVNIGEKYRDRKPLCVPMLLCLRLINDGWHFRQEIIWNKPNPMPSPVKGRCVQAHEQIYLFSRSEDKYYFDYEAIETDAKYAGVPRGGSKNRYEQSGDSMDYRTFDKCRARSVWTVPPARRQVSKDKKHFAEFPEKLIEPCVLAGCPEGGTVLDPFSGAGTTAISAARNGRKSVMCDISKEFVDIGIERFEREFPDE